MKTILIGETHNKLQVSTIILGTVFFGTTIDDSLASRLMDSYFEAGGNCLDTARVYASWLPEGDGSSEKAVGRYLEKRSVRDKILLSTKGGHPRFDSMNKNRLDRVSLQDDLHESLSFLKTDFVDLYFLHRDDPRLPVSEIMPILHQFVTDGKVRILGASNWKAARLAEANEFACAHNLTPFSVSQIQWSYAQTTPGSPADDTLVYMDKTEYDWYAKNKFPVTAFSSQAGGFFSKYLDDGEANLSDSIKNMYCNEDNLKKMETVHNTAVTSGLSATAAALALFLREKSVPLAAVIGSNTEEKLADTLKAAQIKY